jgi:DNA polymerase-3 subunit delta
VIVGAALRQVAQLHRARLAVESGTPVEDAIPGLHFSRKRLVASALSSWSPARLEKIMAQLADASLEARRRPALAEAIAQRALMATATMARRKM